MRAKRVYLLALVLTLSVSSCLLFQPGFKEQYQVNSQTTYDAIIVPGIPFNPPHWQDIMKARVHWAVWLYKNNKTKNIIFTGSAVYTPYLESKIMSLYAQKLGVPVKHIYEESKAQHGSENLYFSYKLAQKLGFEKVALATDPYQGALMFKHNRKFDLDLPYIPVLFDTLETQGMPTPEIEYELAKVDSFVPIGDKYSRLEQYQYSMGKRVKKMIKAERKAKKKAKAKN